MVDKRHCVMFQRRWQTIFTSPNVTEERIRKTLTFRVTLFRDPIIAMLSPCASEYIALVFLYGYDKGWVGVEW